MTPTILETVEEEKLGQFLRRERTKKGIFLSEIAEKTCVRTYYLESIEEGNFQKLPPSLIARGFVRAYASYLGVDPDAAAEKFNSEKTRSTDEENRTSTLGTPHATGGVIRRLEGAFLWFIPRKKRPTVDLCDFMNQIDGAPDMGRTPR